MSTSLKESPLLQCSIVQMIFEYLPEAKDLNNASMVCKTWLQVATMVKKHRRQVYYIEPSVDHVDEVRDALLSMSSQPRLCLIVVRYEEWSYDQKGRRQKILAVLKRLLPWNCVVVGAHATAGLGFSDPEHGFCILQEPMPNPFSILLIPSQAGVNFWDFYLDPAKIKDLKLVLTRPMGGDNKNHLLKQLLNLDRLPDQVRCLVLMGNIFEDDGGCVEALYHHLERTNPGLVVTGGCVDTPIHPDSSCGTNKWPRGIVGVAFMGKAVRIDSVVIPPTIANRSSRESVVRQMKGRYVDDEQSGRESVAFLFSSPAADECETYQTGVAESELFRRHFPDTPLLAFTCHCVVDAQAKTQVGSTVLTLISFPE